EHCVLPGRLRNFINCLKQRLRKTAIVQPPARRYCFLSVARLFGAAFLRLKNIDVTTTGNVERMALFADQFPRLSYQWQVAGPDGKEEQLSSLLPHSAPLNL